jgi:hypothetical protein
MATISTILTKIRQNVIDLPSATEDRLESWVEEAQLELESHLWTFSRTTQTATTIAGNIALANKASDWQTADGDPWYRTGTGSRVRMEWGPSVEDVYKDFSASQLEQDRGAPDTLLEGASQLIVFPPPDASNSLGAYSAAGEYSILVPYIKRHAILSVTGTTENAFTSDPDCVLYLEDFASGKAMLFNRDFENGQMSLTMAQRHKQRAKRIDKRRMMQFLKLTPRRDVNASRRQRRAI